MVAGIVPWNFPIEVALNKIGPGPGRRQYSRSQVRPGHAVGRDTRRPARRGAWDRIIALKESGRHLIAPGTEPHPDNSKGQGSGQVGG
ncbi:hypothetical protein [Nocardia nova]|uniref:hypothetical protein n=1 Tax=Nocardia nova TaxID=37330 RepID=UPI0034D77B81